MLGSDSPPLTLEQASERNSHTQQRIVDESNPSVDELRQLLEQKDKEIRALKSELEIYKSVSHSMQPKQRHTRQQLIGLDLAGESDTQGYDNNDDFYSASTIDSPTEAEPDLALVGETINQPLDRHRRRLVPIDDQADDVLSVTRESKSPPVRLIGRQSTASACSNTSSNKVTFKTGADEDEPEEDFEEQADDSSYGKLQDTTSDIIQDIIQDVGEIDLDMELEGNCHSEQTKEKSTEHDQEVAIGPVPAEQKVGTINKDHDDTDDEDDESRDVISDRLLTSLTDAAICNLSQLAALQERCESQQHSQHLEHQQHETQINQVQRKNQSLLASQAPISATKSSSIATPTSTNSTDLGPIGRNLRQSSTSSAQDETSFDVQVPFSSASIATLAIRAADAVSNLHGQSAMLPQPRQAGSSSSSALPNSTMQADLGSGRSLANAVAAAAAAAAAAAVANDQQQHSVHQLHKIQSRLISSAAVPSPEFYPNLQQHSSSPHPGLTAHQMSPVSSLHFSPTTPLTPSPSSLLASSSRRSISNASSSLLSPIQSPSYFRRQFMPDRLSLMSPSSTSMATSSSGIGSSSLSHILQQSHQRSASALANTIVSPSSTPLSGTGSSSVSPLIGSKSSSQVRLNNMQIKHKFGYLGSGRGQFNSPHGFCLGLDQEIVVADTNNHRICIFDKSGTYITQFGSPGKEEGQLWNPRKVAILHRPIKDSNDGTSSHKNQVLSPYSNRFASEPLYVVCDRGAERSRMQLFTKNGAFIKKIGIHYIDIVAGLAITRSGLIIVVDSVSPTVYIINGETGTLNGWFDCSGHMKEPSDIAVKSDIPGNEYFICDFKGHCVVVFSEQGEYLRKIGHDGLTSYPNGIDISDDGDILVGDSHGNRFHVVVFDRNGNFVSQFECPHVKVSRCCGLKITREGYIVTLAKNNHHVLVLDTIHI